MSLESADRHDSDVMREKNRILEKFVKNALFVVCDVAIFYQSISCAQTDIFLTTYTFYGE